MFTPQLKRSVALVSAPLLLAAGAVTAAPVFTIVNLGVLDGYSSSEGGAINESGHVAGSVENDNGDERGFVWTPESGMVDVGAFAGGDGVSVAEGLNDAGQVVGYSHTSDGQTHGFVWSADSGMRDIGDLPGGDDYSQALDINDAGQVVALSRTDTAAGADTLRTARWDEASGLVELDTGNSGRQAYGQRINASGQIAGHMTTDAGTEAYRIDADGHMVLIGDLAGGGTYGLLGGLNDLGQAVGTGSAASGTHAFFWDETDGIQDIGYLWDGYEFSIANGLNNRGEVVGVSLVEGFQRHAFYWTADSGMLDLNTLIDADSGWVLSRALGINDAGQITGYGVFDGAQRAFVLTPTEVEPVPLPATGLLLLAGLGGLALRRRG